MNKVLRLHQTNHCPIVDGFVVIKSTDAASSFVPNKVQNLIDKTIVDQKANSIVYKYK